MCDAVLVDQYQVVWESDASVFVLENSLFCLEDRGSLFRNRYCTTVARFTLK